MATSRWLFARFGAFLISVPLFAFAFDQANPDSGKGAPAEQASGSELAGGWHFVRTHNPNGGTETISIMHAADTSRSDLDLAGIMIRCSDSGAEVVVVTLPALPFRAQPRVAQLSHVRQVSPFLGLRGSE